MIVESGERCYFDTITKRQEKARDAIKQNESELNKTFKTKPSFQSDCMPMVKTPSKLNLRI